MLQVRSANTVAKTFANVALMMLALTFAATAPRAQDNAQLPDEMLQDGLEALSDGEQSLAGHLFEQLILAFPGSTEADRAQRELSLLESDSRPRTDPAPREASARQGVADSAVLRMKFAVEAGDRVFFAENSAVIGGRARALLENQARWLQARPNLRITIIGRADDGGPEGGAQTLSG